MENILGKTYDRKGMDEVFTQIKSEHPSTNFCFGVTLDSIFFYRFGKFEFWQNNEEATEFICTRTPEAQLDPQEEAYYTTSLQPKDKRKSRAYWTRWDNKSREARKIEQLRHEGKISKDPFK